MAKRVSNNMSGWVERLLRRLFVHKEIGWKDIGESFTLFYIIRTRWFAIQLHRIEAAKPHPQCHDHPWPFITLLIRGGYYEWVDDSWHWRKPGTILYRPAVFRHNVLTKGVSWSIIIRTKKQREWGMMDDCRNQVVGDTGPHRA